VGLPERQGAVLAVLWNTAEPLTAAQITARLRWHGPASTGHALGRLRALGLAAPTSHRTTRWQATLRRDDYLAALVAAALDQASDQPAVLRAALGIPPGRL
jgi:hypothetical protein